MKQHHITLRFRVSVSVFGYKGPNVERTSKDRQSGENITNEEDGIEE